MADKTLKSIKFPHIEDVFHIPHKTSELENDGGFIQDANYVHTDNNFSDELKDKLDSIETGAQVNVQSDWSVSDETSDSFIANKPYIPEKTSDLTNDSDFQTSANVTDAIGSALADFTTFSAEVVSELPEVGEFGTFYFVPDYDQEDDIYKEYIYLNDSWELIGTTRIDLEPYATKEYVDSIADSLADVATSGDYNDLINTPTKLSDFENDQNYQTQQQVSRAIQDAISGASGDITGSLADVAFSGSYNDLIDKPSIPQNLSDLTNDGNFVTDENYHHTDNNFTNVEKSKLEGIAEGAEVNVQSDWNESNSSSDAYIANKPSIPSKVSDLENDSGFISSFTEVDPQFNASAAKDILASDIENWNNKSDFSGSYNDLQDKPSIPTKTSDILNDSGFITTSDIPEGAAASTTIPKADGVAFVGNELAFARGDHVHPSDSSKANASDLENLTESLSTVATSGSYNDLSDKPSIPTKVSDLTNDAGYITDAGVTSINGNTGDVTNIQTTNNLTTSLNASSTDTQYPSAKAVYDYIKALEDRIEALEGELDGMLYKNIVQQ